MWDQKDKLDQLVEKDNSQSDVNGEEDDLVVGIVDVIVNLIFDIGDKLADWYQNLVSDPISSFFYRLKHREIVEETPLQIPCPICGGDHSEKDCPIESEKESKNNQK